MHKLISDDTKQVKVNMFEIFDYKIHFFVFSVIIRFQSC